MANGTRPHDRTSQCLYATAHAAQLGASRSNDSWRSVGTVPVQPNFDEPLIVDRAPHRRDQVDLGATDSIVVRDGAVLARDAQLVQLPAHDLPAASLRVYLGRASAEIDIAALVPAPDVTNAELEALSGGEFVPLRDLFGMFVNRGPASARDQELATTAVALAAWHSTHGHCAACGRPTEPQQGGWVRRCAHDGKVHYPRTDPAIIVAITDADDRLLLAHASAWSPHRYSLLAGYVEPGESFEQAVHREVSEESQLELTDIVYAGSQSWPFPASVMVGFRARTPSPAFMLDNFEITDAMWVTRGELGARVADGTLILAPHGSIARRLVEEWFGGPIE